jgi:hypothetical protein
MKKTILTIAALLVTMNAQASFFQGSCSNNDGTIKVNFGQMKNDVTFTELMYSTGQTLKSEYTMDLYELENISTEEEVVLESKSGQECDDHGGGWGWWSTTTVKKVVYQKKDGTLFSNNTAGVSPDLKTVSAYVVCKDEGNSMMWCGN